MLLLKIFEIDPVLIIPWFCALLFAITIHEFSHGFTAYKLGDDTAANMGRLSLNPLVHLDLFGLLMLVFVGFGWAKPVPINIYNIRKGNFGKFMVSFAGVLANLIMAVVCVLALKILVINGFSVSNFLIKFLAFLVYINLALFVFNLIPVHPLDGYHILELFVPKIFFKIFPFLESWGFFIIIALVFLTNIIGYLIGIIIYIFSVLFNLNIFYLAFGI
ncbi:MAG: site-2 protease family protein [Candidatus Falkowbacteria bacterium]